MANFPYMVTAGGKSFMIGFPNWNWWNLSFSLRIYMLWRKVILIFWQISIYPCHFHIPPFRFSTITFSQGLPCGLGKIWHKFSKIEHSTNFYFSHEVLQVLVFTRSSTTFWFSQHFFLFFFKSHLWKIQRWVPVRTTWQQ